MKCIFNGKAFDRKMLGLVTQQIWKIMKLMMFLLTVLALQVSARGFGQTITFHSKEKITVEKALNIITEQTGYSFIGEKDILNNAPTITLSLKKVTLTDALNQCLKGLPLTYDIEGKIVVLIGRVVLTKRMTALANESTVEKPDTVIHGRVTDNAGKPLVGVTIQVKGTTMGTTTDVSGKFSLSVPNNAVLLISSLGYTQKEEPVNGRKVVNITLAPTTTGLNQLVVIGYGTQKKGDLTGAISSIKSNELQKISSTSFTSAIEGKVPGVFVSQTGGAPGSAVSVQIRGVGTTGNNQPLYVVDGIPINTDEMGIPGSSYSVDALSIINPNDIASIEILKDAAATAIYGARGGNGVVLITTKQGEAGKANITFKASTGFSQVWRKPEFLDAEQFATMANELYVNSGLTPNPQWADPASLGKGTDMVGLIFRNAPQHRYNLSFSGGSKKFSGRLSLGYTKQEGTIIETNYKQYTGRASFNLNPGNHFHFGGSLAFAATQSKGQNTNSMQGGILNLAEQFFPTLNADSPFYGDALYYTKDGDNPILRAQTIDNNLNDFRVLGNVFGEYEFVPGLKFRTNVGIDGDFDKTSSWQGQIVRGFYIHPLATLSDQYGQDLTWDIENTLSYSKQFGANSVSVVLGQSGRKEESSWIEANGNGFLNESLRVINTSDLSTRQASGTGSMSTIASYFGRVNYSFEDKYLLSASLRRDGSSNFGPNNKWGYFPAVSAGWRISDEAFMNPLKKVVDNLKIRGSWGRTGNDAIPAFGYLTTIQYGTNYDLGPTGDIITGTSMSRPGNPNLKWETDEQIDAGLDAELLNNKFSLTIDYYVKNTIGMLISLPVSIESGFQNPPSVNGGRVQNRGLELSLGYDNNFGDFHFTVNGNISILKNVVKSLGVGQPIVGGIILPILMLLLILKWVIQLVILEAISLMEYIKRSRR